MTLRQLANSLLANSLLANWGAWSHDSRLTPNRVESPALIALWQGRGRRSTPWDHGLGSVAMSQSLSSLQIGSAPGTRLVRSKRVIGGIADA